MTRYLVPIAFLLVAIPCAAQSADPNDCDVPGARPDVIVGELPGVMSYGNVGDIYAYAIGTTSCNIGTCELDWYAWTNRHPVIAQNMYKLKDGRMTQVGQSWLKHGFAALSLDLCSEDCVETNGATLGVNCSDPYWASLNGSQGGLGPRFEVNAATGEFPYPFGGGSGSFDPIYKRLQVHRDDLDPSLNPGALYFVEGHYIAHDDAAARNDNNNAAWREVFVNPDAKYTVTPTGATMRESPAIDAWKTYHPEVIQQHVDIARDGRLVLAGRTTELPGGGRRYEYAIQNVNSDRSMRRFEVPVPLGAVVTNIGFNDVEYHSGEIQDNTDWDAYHDTAARRVVWETATYQENPQANALRWGTMYTFWFDIDREETIVGPAMIGLFKPPASIIEGFPPVFVSPTPAGGYFANLPTPDPGIGSPAIQLEWHGESPAPGAGSRERVDSGTKPRR